MTKVNQAIESYLVTYKSLGGEWVTSEWIFDEKTLESYMCNLVGRAFIATLERFKLGKYDGIMHVTLAGDTGETWVKNSAPHVK